MIKPTDTPNFKDGEDLSAAKFNKLAQMAEQSMLAGMFSMPGMVLQRPQAGGGSGGYQLVRGQTVTSVAPIASAFQIENLVAFEEGATLPNAPLWIASPPGGITLGGGVYVWAAYHAGFAIFDPGDGDVPVDWAMVTSPNEGSEKYRLIQGHVTATVTADMGTFTVDLIIPLANGNDPSGGSPSTTVTVVNANGDTFEEDQQIDITWYDTGLFSGWTTLLTERYREIQGTVYTTGSPLHVKNVQPMLAGRDPRTDPTDSDELVDVTDYLDQAWTVGDIIYAAWNAGTLTWEAMAKPATAEKKYTAHITSPISAGSAATPTSGSGTVYEVAADGTTTSVGAKTIYNPYEMAAKGECAVLRLSDDTFEIAGLPLSLSITATLDGDDLVIKLFNHDIEVSSATVEGDECPDDDEEEE